MWQLSNWMIWFAGFWCGTLEEFVGPHCDELSLTDALEAYSISNTPSTSWQPARISSFHDKLKGFLRLGENLTYIWRKYPLFSNDFEAENVANAAKARLTFAWPSFVALKLTPHNFEEANFDCDISFVCCNFFTLVPLTVLIAFLQTTFTVVRAK